MVIRRAWIYARVSTRLASQATSPDAQIERLTRIAELKGWAVAGQGFDRVSGAGVLPELARGLAAIRSSAAHVLMVSDLDRLGGTMRGILDTAELIGNLGGDLFVESYQIDTTTPIGKFFFQTLAAFAELRRTLQNDKIRRGVASARARGRRLGRAPTYYPSPKLVARAAELRAAGQSWRAIVVQMRAEKIAGVPAHPTLRRWVLEPPPHIAAAIWTPPAAGAGA